ARDRPRRRGEHRHEPAVGRGRPRAPAAHAARGEGRRRGRACGGRGARARDGAVRRGPARGGPGSRGAGRALPARGRAVVRGRRSRALPPHAPRAARVRARRRDAQRALPRGLARRRRDARTHRWGTRRAVHDDRGDERRRARRHAPARRAPGPAAGGGCARHGGRAGRGGRAVTAPGAPLTAHDGPEASARPGVARGGATGADAHEPVLSVVVMHHPARGDVSALVRACAPLDVRVVEDADPDGPPSPLRTAKRAWAAVAPGATHHLVLQDGVTPVPGFAGLVRRAVRARPRHAVALSSNWNSPRNAYLVRAAAAAGQAWAPLGHDEWVPTLGLVLPADGALRLAA